MDAFEFTNAQYAEFLNRSGNNCGGHPCYVADKEGSALREQGGRWSAAKGLEQRPVTRVTWYGAQAACASTGRRLCQAAEWPQACAGGANTTFPYGNTFDPAACNVFEHGHKDVVDVGSMAGCQGGYPGLFDLSGNVWEWTQVCTPLKCAVRGGSFTSYRVYTRCDYWDEFSRETPDRYVGFRCCAALGS
jgi:formylglycine-generating enzyme